MGRDNNQFPADIESRIRQAQARQNQRKLEKQVSETETATLFCVGMVMVCFLLALVAHVVGGGMQ